MAESFGLRAARFTLQVLQAPTRVSDALHSLSRQVRRTPLTVTAGRIAQVVKGGSPLLRPLWRAEEEVLARLQLGNGALEVADLSQRAVRKALEQQGITRLEVQNYDALRLGPDRAMVMLKAATAGLEEDRIYTYVLDRFTLGRPKMQIVRAGSEVRVNFWNER